MVSSRALKYARALLEIAWEQDGQDEVLQELRICSDLLQPGSELMAVLVNPAIPFSAKRGVMEQVAEKVPLSPIVLNFILVLLENARMDQFEQMIAAYQMVLDERRGVVQADLFSCREVSQALRRRLEKVISNFTGGGVKLNVHRDASLIGGFKIQFGSTILDASIRAQLNEIRRHLAEG